MAKNEKPAVGLHGINQQAENAAKSSNLDSGTMCDQVIMQENQKRDYPHRGSMPKKGSGAK